MSNLKATHIFEIRINAEGDKLCLANPSNDDSGAYRIAGPKAWGGSSLIGDIEIRESNLVTYIKEYAPHLAPLIASDLINELQARVVELETEVNEAAKEKDMEHYHRRAVDEENETLKARVMEYERLHRELATTLEHDAESPSLCDLVAVDRTISKERDALAAHVERLREQLGRWKRKYGRVLERLRTQL